MLKWFIMEANWAYTFKQKKRHYKVASLVSLITIVFYSALAYFSVIFGMQDDSIALFGFGLYSAAEVISGIGILNMIMRMRQNHGGNNEKIEKTALRIICVVFYLAAAALAVASAMSIRIENRPETTFWSIMVAIISIFLPAIFMAYMVKAGRQLNSQALIAEANRTTAGIFASASLLISGFGFEFLGISVIDSLGAVAIAVSSVAKGNSAFRRIKGHGSVDNPQKSTLLPSYKSQPDG